MDVRIDGLEEILNGMDYAPRIIGEEVDDATDEVLGVMVRALATYPPPPANSTYVRTNKLKDGWTEPVSRFSVGLGGVSKTVRNNIRYGPLVQSREDQAKIHQGRWQTVEDVQERYEGDTERALQRASDRAARRIENGET